MVRFGDEIRARVFQPWIVYCIDYDAVKQKVKRIAEAYNSSSSNSSSDGNEKEVSSIVEFQDDGENGGNCSVSRNNEDAEESLQDRATSLGPDAVFEVRKLINNEIDRVSSFQKQQQRNLLEEIERAQNKFRSLREWKASGYSSLDAPKQSLHKRFIELGQNLAHLLLYVELNVTGLRKLLRKFDKYSHQQVGSSLLIAFNPEIQALCDTHALDVIARAIEDGIIQTGSSSSYMTAPETFSTSPLHRQVRNSSQSKGEPCSEITKFVLVRYGVGAMCLAGNDAENESLLSDNKNYGTLRQALRRIKETPTEEPTAISLLWGSVVVAISRINMALLVPFLTLFFIARESTAMTLGIVSALLAASACGNMLCLIVATFTRPNGMFLTYVLVISWMCLLGDLLLWRGLFLDKGDTVVKYLLMLIGCFMIGVGRSLEAVLRTLGKEKDWKDTQIVGNSVQVVGALTVSVGSLLGSVTVIHAGMRSYQPMKQPHGSSLSWAESLAILWGMICLLTAAGIAITWGAQKDCNRDIEPYTRRTKRTNNSRSSGNVISRGMRSFANTRNGFQFGSFGPHALGTFASHVLFSFSYIVTPLVLSCRKKLFQNFDEPVPAVGHLYAHTSMWFFIGIWVVCGVLEATCAIIHQMGRRAMHRNAVGILFSVSMLSNCFISFGLSARPTIDLFLRVFTAGLAITSPEWFEIIDARPNVPSYVRSRMSAGMGLLVGCLLALLFAIVLPDSLVPLAAPLSTSKLPEILSLLLTILTVVPVLQLALASHHTSIEDQRNEQQSEFQI